MASRKTDRIQISPAGEGKTEGKTIQPGCTKLDTIGQNSHAKRLRSQSKQHPGDLKKLLAEFDSPPSLDNKTERTVCIDLADFAFENYWAVHFAFDI